MIDRKARDAMAGAIQAFMDQKICSRKFDDMIFEIARNSHDQSVAAISHALWWCYSDAEDHKIRAEKRTWDFLNRLRLVLASDVEAEWYRAGARWNIYRTLSALLLAGLGFVAWQARLGKALLVSWLLAGLAGLVLLWVWNHNDIKAAAADFPVFPFPSLKSLLATRRQVTRFARKRYPQSLLRRAKLHRYLDKAMWVLRGPLLMAFAPLLLLILVLPLRQQSMRLNPPLGTAKD